MKLAVVVPARNAERLLADCLAAILRQSRPPDEVLLVIGPSSDRTMEIGRSLGGSQVLVLENPAGDRGSALNAALAHTDADLVAFVDAQATLAADYLQAAERALDDHAVAVVGGSMRPQGHGTTGEAMASALRSPFGVGNSQFHFAGTARDVESVYLGVYRRSVFDRVGRYNSTLLRTEDDDLNARVRAVGLRIRLDPSIRSVYRCRESLAAIWRQFYGYGFWKLALSLVRPGALRARHFAPAVFVVALVLTGGAAVAGWWVPLFMLAGAWVLAAAVAALLAPADTARARALFPVVVLTMHVAYGTGMVISLLSIWRLRSRIRAGARLAEDVAG